LLYLPNVSGGKREKVTVTAQFEAAGQFLLSINTVEIPKPQLFVEGLPLRQDTHMKPKSSYIRKI
jgi:hypothetical protein